MVFILHFALLLLVPLHLSLPSLALHVSRVNYTMAPVRGFTELADFGYRLGGRISMTLSNVYSLNASVPLNDTMLRNISLYFVRSDDWYTFNRVVLISLEEPCVLTNKFLQAEWNNTFSGLNLSSNNTVQWNKTVSQDTRYELVLFNCLPTAQGFKFSYDVSMVNFYPNGQQTQLGSGLMDLPTVYLVFFSILWPIAWIPWWFNWYRHRKEKIWLHRLLLFTPPLQMLRAFFLWLTYNAFSVTGSQPISIEVILLIFHALSSFVHHLSRLLISKGWCLTRLHLLKIEWRTVGGAALFMVTSDTFQTAVGGGANIALLTFMCLFYTYMWLNFRHQDYVLSDFKRILRQRNASEAIYQVYEQKGLLLESLQRFILGFGLIIIIISIMGYLFLTGESTYYILITLGEIVIYADSLMVGFFCRLRTIEPIDVSKKRPNANSEGTVFREQGRRLRLMELLRLRIRPRVST